MTLCTLSGAGVVFALLCPTPVHSIGIEPQPQVEIVAPRFTLEMNYRETWPTTFDTAADCESQRKFVQAEMEKAAEQRQIEVAPETECRAEVTR